MDIYGDLLHHPVIPRGLHRSIQIKNVTSGPRSSEREMPGSPGASGEWRMARWGTWKNHRINKYIYIYV